MKINFENITPLFQPYKKEIILGLCALFLAYVIATSIKGARNDFLPGPMSLPLVGYLPFMTRDVHLDIMKLGKKYGDVFRVKLGSQDIVMLNGSDAIIEALNKSQFLGKPPDSAPQKALKSSPFFGSNFLLWEEQRKIAVKFMKYLGLGKSKMEETIMEEVNIFMDILRKSQSQPIDIWSPATSSLSNNITFIIFGKRFKYDDPERKFLDKNLVEFFKELNNICVDVLFPWISYIPFAKKFLQIHKSKTAVKNFHNFFLKEITEHKKTLNPAHIRDFMDLYLVEIEKQKGKLPDTSFTQNMLISNALDIFLAASETVLLAFLWIIRITAAYPDVQKKVQKEIMEVIGTERAPNYLDMRNMPYTRAVIMETLRWRTLTPVSLIHYTLADTKVGGYDIRKGQSVIYNIWAIHHDPKYWDEPEKFKPERFLSKDYKTVIKPKYFIPFLAGGRVCPGESMAYLELFLYYTSILREFDIVFPDKVTTLNGKFTLIYLTDPYFVRFIPKN